MKKGCAFVFFVELFTNEVLVVPICAWLIAQILKTCGELDSEICDNNSIYFYVFKSFEREHNGYTIEYINCKRCEVIYRISNNGLYK